MTAATVLALLPLLACAACLLLLCRPGKKSCHTDADSEKARLREEIETLRAQLDAQDQDSPTAR